MLNQGEFMKKNFFNICASVALISTMFTHSAYGCGTLTNKTQAEINSEGFETLKESLENYGQHRGNRSFFHNRTTSDIEIKVVAGDKSTDITAQVLELMSINYTPSQQTNTPKRIGSGLTYTYDADTNCYVERRYSKYDTCADELQTTLIVKELDNKMVIYDNKNHLMPFVVTDDYLGHKLNLLHEEGEIFDILEESTDFDNFVNNMETFLISKECQRVLGNTNLSDFIQGTPDITGQVTVADGPDTLSLKASEFKENVDMIDFIGTNFLADITLDLNLNFNYSENSFDAINYEYTVNFAKDIMMSDIINGYNPQTDVVVNPNDNTTWGEKIYFSAKYSGIMNNQYTVELDKKSTITLEENNTLNDFNLDQLTRKVCIDYVIYHNDYYETERYYMTTGETLIFPSSEFFSNVKWYLDKDCTIESTNTVAPNTNLTLYAKKVES